MFQVFGTKTRTIDLADFEVVDDRPASSEDLPCPWCYAATSETDASCPSCHRRFGRFDAQG